LPIAADDGVLTAPFPAPNSRYEPFAQTEFQLVDDPKTILRFEQPSDAGFQRMTVQGPLRSLSGSRAATPS
jgi:hypothetical protein